MRQMGNFFRAIGRIGRIGIVWLNRWLRDFGIVAVSIAVMVLHLMLVCAGVSSQNRLLIVLSGLAASLYFCIVVFLVLKRPALFQGLITRLGFILNGGKWSAKGKKRARGLWFFAVAPLFFTFWLAMFPTQTMGFVAIVSALCLFTLFLIGFWQKIPSDFWKAYYKFGKKAFPIIIVLVFVVYAPFAKFWNSVGKFVLVKSEQAAVWFASPPKAEKRAVPPAGSAERKAAPEVRQMVARSAPPLPAKKVDRPAGVLAPRLPAARPLPSVPASDDDLLIEAAKAADRAKREALAE